MVTFEERFEREDKIINNYFNKGIYVIKIN